MAPRFDQPDEPVEGAVRRIACAHIDAAIAIIDDPALSPEQKVHEVRQRCKKLRALLRLVRPAFTGFEVMNALFRDIAGSLSGARDARVMVDTIDALVAASDGDLAGVDTDAIRAHLSAAQEDAPDQSALLADCRGRLVDARAHAARWTLTAEGWDALSGGLEKSYRRARQGMKASRKHPDAEISHDWRKHVKHHGAHLRLLRDIQPDFLHTAVKKVGLLADHLGERHDIDMLIARLSDPAQRVAKEAEIAQFLHVAKKRLAHLDKAAQRLGQRLFEAKASEQQKRWSDWWQEWREG